MTEVSPTSTEWIERVIQLLDLGSGGVMVLVDNAHDSHAGYLARAILTELGQFHEARSAAELREAPAGAAVLLRLRDPADVVALNIGRQVVRDNALRVAVWGTPDVMAVLPTQAFDFYDWISHRVECAPRRAFRWMVRTFDAARRVRRPIWWVGARADLDLTISEAWAEPCVEAPGSDYAAVLAAIRSRGTTAVVRVDHENDAFRLRCAMAETDRAGGVVAVAETLYSTAWGGFWHLGSQRPDGPALIDCEDELMPRGDHWEADDPVADHVRSLVPRDETYSAVVGHAPPAELRALGTGEHARGLLLRALGKRSSWTREVAAWALLLETKRDFAVSDATTARQRIEGALWASHRTGELDRGGLAERAAGEGLFDLAIAWAGDLPAARDTVASIRVVHDYERRGPNAALEVALEQRGHVPTGSVLATVTHVLLAIVSAEEDSTVGATALSTGGAATLLRMVRTGAWSEIRGFPSPARDVLQLPEVDALSVVDWAADRGSSDPRRRKGAFAHWLDHLLADDTDVLNPSELMRARGDAAALLGERETWWEGWLQGRVGKALARLGRRESARFALLDAEGILLRTTNNRRHPLILMSRFERVWLDVVEKSTPVEELDQVLAELENALWPEHREVVAARALRRRV